MSDARETLRRGIGGFAPRPDGYERVLQRRDRRRRNQRIMAGAVAAVIVVTGALAFFFAVRTETTPTYGDMPAGGPVPPTLTTGSEALVAGTYLLDLDARGSGVERFPNVAITVPDGWANIDGWGVDSDTYGDHWVGITFWDVDGVYAHPCQWKGEKIQPGPTVAGLAKVLAKQPLRDATQPVDIVVDGFDGKQLQWSVPANIDFSTCDFASTDGRSFFESWIGAPGSWATDRYQQGPGQVDRLWILDVNGERFVVDAMYMPSTDAKDRQELWQVMDSIHFET
jgi:hypothetical protein